MPFAGCTLRVRIRPVIIARNRAVIAILCGLVASIALYLVSDSATTHLPRSITNLALSAQSPGWLPSIVAFGTRGGPAWPNGQIGVLILTNAVVYATLLFGIRQVLASRKAD